MLLLATSADESEGKGVDEEKILVNLLEIVPFDDGSRERVKKEIKKLKEEGKVKEFLVKVIDDVYKSRERAMGEEVMRKVEKFSYLGSIDHMWIEHIDAIDGLREGVRLRGYAQRDPVAEFKNEAYQMFEGLLDRIDDELSRRIFRVGVSRMPSPEIPLEEARTNVDQLDKTGLTAGMGDELTAAAGEPAFSGSSSQPDNQPTSRPSSKQKVGRNDPCPCGAINPNTGKPYKYKKCGLINAPHHKG